MNAASAKVEEINTQENTEEQTEYEFKDHSRELLFGKRNSNWCIKVNPVVSAALIIAVAIFVGYSAAEPDDANKELGNWRTWITNHFSWAYISSQTIWFFFLVYILFSKYSSIKLGKQDEEPEFNFLTWFMLMFSCGIGIGLYFFGVMEPVWYYRSDNRWKYYHNICGTFELDSSGAPIHPDDNMYVSGGAYTVGSNFTVTGGTTYQTMCWPNENRRALNALNTTMYHWGVHAWIVYAIIGISLGFLSYRKGLPMTIKSTFFPLIGTKIWGWIGEFIDFVAAVCTLFGITTSLGLGAQQINTGLNLLDSNIKVSNNSQVAIIWIITVVATSSVVTGLHIGIRRLSEINFGISHFLLTFVMLHGHTWLYLNQFVQMLGYYIWDFFEISFNTQAWQLHSDGRAGGEAPGGHDGPAYWMDFWTIFYFGWWISWCPFVGTFIARISRGRTIREFIGVVLFVPTLYAFLWFSVFGSAGIAMQREAENLGLGGEYGGESAKSTYGSYTVYPLYDLTQTEMWFRVLEQYGVIGDNLLWGLSIVGIALYFVTSSDSGSLVIDMLTANGDQHPPIPQRVFWALLEGAVASVLIGAGNANSANALRAVSIAGGLPLTLFLVLQCFGLYNALRDDCGEINFFGGSFWSIQLLDFLDKPTVEGAKKVALYTVAPWYGIMKVSRTKFNDPATGIISCVFFNLFIICYLIQPGASGMWAVAWSFFFFFVFTLMSVRTRLRQRYHIFGDIFSDFFAALLVPMLVVYQSEHLVENGPGVFMTREVSKNGKTASSDEEIPAI